MAYATEIGTGTALITGASSGFGYEFSKLFAADGHDVILVARSEGKLRELATDLHTRHGVEATVIPQDLSLPDAAQTLFDELVLRKLNVSFLVNNAGVGLHKPFTETELARELSLIRLNVMTVTHLTKLLLPGMVGRGQGRILNVSSTAAFAPTPWMAVYGATKSLVHFFSQSLAAELRGSGVTVTVLCPGFTPTGFQESADVANKKLVALFSSKDAAEVARAGYRGMLRGKVLVVPGLINKMTMWGARWLPYALTRPLALLVLRAMGEGR